MSVKGERITVATTATRLDSNINASRVNIIIRNRGSQPVYLGAADVTTSTGFQLDIGESLTAEEVRALPGLFGIVAATTAVVHVLSLAS